MASPRAMMVLALCAVWQATQVTSGYYTNLLVNPSFEADIKNNWRSNGFVLARDEEDVLHGLYSLKCSNRTSDTYGPSQQVNEFLKGRHYAFEGYVKLLQDVPGKPWQTIKVIIQMTVSFQTSVLTYNIVFRSFCTTSQGWIRLQGDIEAPLVDFTSTDISIRGPDAGVDFLVDNLTLYELPENPNWRQQADVNIETYRKANITINVKLPVGVSPSDIDLEISQKSHEFAFGSMVRDYEVLAEPTSPYMNIAYYLFDWMTIQSYKWKFNQGVPESVEDFTIATSATDKLLSKGKKVRGHSVFWDVEDEIPSWVKNLTTNDTLPILRQHLEYMINLTSNRLEQFDIQNEHIVGHYFEEKLNDPSVTTQMFQHARALNTPVKLYLNDFQCVVSGAQTDQYYDLAMNLLSNGPILDGLGIQGHTKSYVKPDPTQMLRRLDKLAKTGLELMMTEFDIAWPDDVVRADWLEDSIRAFFSHPKLSGVILWDFWNKSMRLPNKALVGDDYTILESGQRYACLVRKEWTTHTRLNLGSSGTTTTLRAFQGQYDVVVWLAGTPVQVISLYNGKQGATWNIDVTTEKTAITVPVKEDLVPQCVSHRDQTSLGTASSTSTTPTLTCRTLQSDPSGPNENDAASVTCGPDEVMTGCSSVHLLYNNWTRNGEKILMVNNTPTCAAYNGRSSAPGVVAIARCCQLSGLSCDYRVAGPSYPFDGAMAEARCPSGATAIGCSGYSAYPDFDGVRPSNNVTLSGCLAQSGTPYFSDPAEKSGAMAFSVCCQALGLTCQVLESAPSDLTPGSQSWVVCPADRVMTACNVMAPSGRAAGVQVFYDGTTEICTAFMGDTLPFGSTGVIAMATCCRV